MTLDGAHFTPLAALAGGALLGLAAVILLLGLGRIMGISGIAGALLRRGQREPWRIAFVLGLVAAPAVAALTGLELTARIDAGWSAVVLAGLLVGVGTRYGSGCTSGHGVCGLSRQSPRSIAATAAFMAAGFVTVYLLRHAGV
ncbi:YeeE/YedE family protein [Amphibiibacter pelophylacis]|uniref:YeeE/YedE family protein n=1 Tax=Amphibiibacter pelophylacis TaxID=1799477 RepID=A0ACC6NZ79_9BURK